MRASPWKRSRGKFAQPSEPFLRFYHCKALRNNALPLLDAVERARDATAHRDALANVIVELTNGGMDTCFMKPLRLAKAGFVVQQPATVGVAGVQQVMGPVIRGIISRMDRPQLLSVCGARLYRNRSAGFCSVRSNSTFASNLVPSIGAARWL
jgi:hypothetical protein